jgi:hypothetical protein
MKSLLRCVVAISLMGCKRTWEKAPAPDILGTNGLASVISFVATNGWDSYGGTNDTVFWEYMEPNFYISDLPWKKWKGQRFQALTQDGILYVLRGDQFSHDYYGVAYNPNTNQFPRHIRSFKPIGDHWYVWAQPEFWDSATTDGRYE